MGLREPLEEIHTIDAIFLFMGFAQQKVGKEHFLTLKPRHTQALGKHWSAQANFATPHDGGFSWQCGT